MHDLESIIDDECTRLCSTTRPTDFRKPISAQRLQLEGFSWKKYSQELSTIAPTLWAVIRAATTSLGTKYTRKHADTEDKQSTACVLAAAVLLKERNMHMSSVQHLLSLLLWNGNTTTMVSIHYICIHRNY